MVKKESGDWRLTSLQSPKPHIMMNHNEKKRVVVAMSGGVDSSVAAALLKHQGHEVIGLMMRLWSEPGMGAAAPHNRCCTPDQMADARRVADKLDIPFYVLDTQDYFRHTIVEFFLEEHRRGRTPNPCIECNRKVRFDYLLNQAMALDADYLATGHYARVRHTDQGYQLLKGLDEAKDQSYVLHVMGQNELSRVLFPIGEYEKSQVRELAQQFGLPVASKGESQDLCFLGDGDYRRFLRDYAADLSQPGPIVNTAGQVLGQHEGLSNYTIGQRKGLGISAPEPLFVLRKEAPNNALIVGTKEEMGQSELIAHTVNWMSDTVPDGPIRAEVKIRYKARQIPATITPWERGRAHVQFDEYVHGIAAGQGAIFYQGDLCLGGGLIADAVTETESIVLPVLM